MKKLLLIVLALVAACASLDSPTTRATAHELRVQIEAELRAAQAETGDENLLRRIDQAASLADTVADSWDAYLASPDRENRSVLRGTLNAALFAAEALVPDLGLQGDAEVYVRAGLGTLRILLVSLTTDLGETELRARAEALPEG